MFPSPNLGLSLKSMKAARAYKRAWCTFPSPNLGLSLKYVATLTMMPLLSFRPLIWGYL